MGTLTVVATLLAMDIMEMEVLTVVVAVAVEAVAVEAILERKNRDVFLGGFIVESCEAGFPITNNFHIRNYY